MTHGSGRTRRARRTSTRSSFVRKYGYASWVMPIATYAPNLRFWRSFGASHGQRFLGEANSDALA